MPAAYLALLPYLLLIPFATLELGCTIFEFIYLFGLATGLHFSVSPIWLFATTQIRLAHTFHPPNAKCKAGTRNCGCQIICSCGGVGVACG